MTNENAAFACSFDPVRLLRHVLISVACLTVAMSGTPALAGPGAQTAPQALIVSPVRGQTVQGNATIQGTARADAFARYEVAYAAEPGLATWLIIGGGVQPVDNNVLAVWNTRPVADGAYALRVQVISSDGTSAEGVVRNIVVANQTAAPAPAAAGGETTPAASSASTATSAAASLTLDLSDVPGAFIRGARAVLIAFGALGAYIVLKKALAFVLRWLFSRPTDYGR